MAPKRRQPPSDTAAAAQVEPVARRSRRGAPERMAENPGPAAAEEPAPALGVRRKRGAAGQATQEGNGNDKRVPQARKASRKGNEQGAVSSSAAAGEVDAANEVAAAEESEADEQAREAEGPAAGTAAGTDEAASGQPDDAGDELDADDGLLDAAAAADSGVVDNAGLDDLLGAGSANGSPPGSPTRSATGSEPEPAAEAVASSIREEAQAGGSADVLLEDAVVGEDVQEAIADLCAEVGGHGGSALDEDDSDDSAAVQAALEAKLTSAKAKFGDALVPMKKAYPSAAALIKRLDALEFATDSLLHEDEDANILSSEVTPSPPPLPRTRHLQPSCASQQTVHTRTQCLSIHTPALSIHSVAGCTHRTCRSVYTAMLRVYTFANVVYTHEQIRVYTSVLSIPISVC